jgi:uncharacterized protein involved in cysteine biosynthesis
MPTSQAEKWPKAISGLEPLLVPQVRGHVAQLLLFILNALLLGDNPFFDAR